MDQDTLRYDSLYNRPLPKWLTDQRDGLNTIQPSKIVIKKDNSLEISFALTAIFIIFIVILLTAVISQKKNNQKK
jgi:hypothetical protein